MAKLTDFIRKQPRWRIAVVAVLAVFGLILLLRGDGKTTGEGATFTARRGPLDITVIEGGSLQALESQEIKCEVRVGYQGTKILKIVEEGYQVTDDDVANGKVLIELDSSEIQKLLVQQEITLQASMAAFADAQQTYEIQLNQNVTRLNLSAHRHVNGHDPAFGGHFHGMNIEFRLQACGRGFIDAYVCKYKPKQPDTQHQNYAGHAQAALAQAVGHQRLKRMVKGRCHAVCPSFCW